jgi:hypothetical protein
MNRLATIMSPRALAALAALAIGATQLAAVAADPVRITLPVTESFSAVRLVGPFDLVLTQAPTTTLYVEGDPAQVRRVTAHVEGDVLVVGEQKKGFLNFETSHRTARVLLSTPKLSRISTSGSGDVFATSWKTDGPLDVALSGSGDLKIESLVAQKLVVSISGSSDVMVGGTVEAQHINIAGSGDYDAGELKSATASISIAGSGDATLWVAQALSISIAGSGDVKYYGTPTISQSVVGSGNVQSAGTK